MLWYAILSYLLLWRGISIGSAMAWQGDFLPSFCIEQMADCCLFATRTHTILQDLIIISVNMGLILWCVIVLRQQKCKVTDIAHQSRYRSLLDTGNEIQQGFPVPPTLTGHPSFAVRSILRELSLLGATVHSE